MPTLRKLQNDLEIMEKKEAFHTQIDIIVLVYHLGLSYISGSAHISHVPKPLLQHVLFEAAKMTSPTIRSLRLLMKIVRTIQSSN